MATHLKTVSDVNLVASFLADAQVEVPDTLYEVDTVVICASAVLYGAETVFRRLQHRSLTAKNLVLCGGVGHSTSLIWDAVAHHPEYCVLSSQVQGLPEARVLELLLHRHFDVDKIINTGCQILVEDRSTNCGANAIETRKVLETASSSNSSSRAPHMSPSTVMIVQDPTMALRTRAAFEKVFDDVPMPPVFHKITSMTQNTTSGFRYAIPGISESQLWDMNRFIELIIGEIPRLRDDESGYGPKGKNFITHVDMPHEVEDAWKRIREIFGSTR